MTNGTSAWPNGTSAWRNEPEACLVHPISSAGQLAATSGIGYGPAAPDARTPSGVEMARVFAFVVLLLTSSLAACGSSDAGGSTSDGFDWDAFWAEQDASSDADDASSDADDAPDEDTSVEDEPDVPVFVGSDDGEPCDDDAACAGGECLPDPDWADGHCNTPDCAVDGDCFSPDAACVTADDVAVCAVRCGDDGDCRDGYSCLAVTEDGGACLPTPESTGAFDGQPCAVDDDCIGGTCLQDPDWPDGYCTTRFCETFVDCARGEFNNRCLVRPDGNFCVRICSAPSDCRTGYVCQGVGGGVGICIPSQTDPVEPETEFEDYPFDIVCGLEPEGGEVAIAYEIAEDTTSYMIVPFARDGATIQPSTIELPDGDEIDLQGGANGYQIANSFLFGYINPIIVPFTEAFAGQLQAGSHTLRVETSSRDLCWYVHEESTAGSTIDLNIFLVGVPGASAETAEDDPNLSQMVETFEAIWEPAGFTVGEVRWFDAAEDVSTRYSIIRGQGDAQRLVANTDLPGDTTDEALSVNVFFTRAFRFSDGSGVIGISLGIPGPAGLHGTGNSGVVFTSEFFGTSAPDGTDGTDYTAIVFAHEIGHYLGLFHTTEQSLDSFDPVEDTPECRSGFPGSCPDLRNLMFPLAGADHTIVTPGQAAMVRANPLTKD